jgi:hypothetical protein
VPEVRGGGNRMIAFLVVAVLLAAMQHLPGRRG